jgi:SPP1 gp7 family putative phage head morphogenesis protein
MKDFGATQKLERDYAAMITRFLGRVLPRREETETLGGYLQRLRDVSEREDVAEVSDYIARRMVMQVNARNLKNWRVASDKSQRSRALYRLLQGEMRTATGSAVTRIIQTNASYIRGLPRKVAEQLEDEVLRAQQAGSRPSTVAKLARTRYPQLLRSRVNTISRTEPQKTSLALTQARCEDLNLPFYIWETSEDVRVRDSHRKMNGVVVPWASAPSPESLVGLPSEGNYHAGGIYNCRCTQLVVLTLDDITFPARVYWKGRIQMMTRVQFKNVAVGVEDSRAA